MSDPLQYILTGIALSTFLLGLYLSLPLLREQREDRQVKRLKRKLRRELDRLQQECHVNYERMSASDIAQILAWQAQIDEWDPPELPAQPKEASQDEAHVWLYNLPGQRPTVRDMLEMPPVVPHFSDDNQVQEGNPWWNQEQQRLLREIEEILEQQEF